MISNLAVDTHALVWYLLKSARISATALGSMEDVLRNGGVIHVPSVCLVEVIYLAEKQRLPWSAWERLREYLDRPDSGLDLVPLDRGIAEALRRVPREHVPDMPDRIIAATAFHLGVPLVTRDESIRASGIETIW